MAGRRGKKRRPIRCPACGERAEWTKTLNCGWLYQCVACGRWTREEEAPAPDDGRITGSEDALERLAGALERATTDGRLSTFERTVHAVYCDRAAEFAWVEIMASDYWVCERLGLDPARDRNRVRRARARLEGLNYVRRLKLSEVTGRHLKAAVEARRAKGKKLPTLLEVRKAPPLPRCAHCDAEMPDALRVSMRYCSPRCRKAAGRSTSPRLEALLDAALVSR